VMRNSDSPRWSGQGQRYKSRAAALGRALTKSATPARRRHATSEQLLCQLRQHYSSPARPARDCSDHTDNSVKDSRSSTKTCWSHRSPHKRGPDEFRPAIRYSTEAHSNLQQGQLCTRRRCERLQAAALVPTVASKVQETQHPGYCVSRSTSGATSLQRQPKA